MKKEEILTKLSKDFFKVESESKERLNEADKYYGVSNGYKYRLFLAYSLVPYVVVMILFAVLVKLAIMPAVLYSLAVGTMSFTLGWSQSYLKTKANEKLLKHARDQVDPLEEEIKCTIEAEKLMQEKGQIARLYSEVKEKEDIEFCESRKLNEEELGRVRTNFNKSKNNLYIGTEKKYLANRFSSIIDSNVPVLVSLVSGFGMGALISAIAFGLPHLFIPTFSSKLILVITMMLASVNGVYKATETYHEKKIFNKFNNMLGKDKIVVKNVSSIYFELTRELSGYSEEFRKQYLISAGVPGNDFNNNNSTNLSESNYSREVVEERIEQIYPEHVKKISMDLKKKN